MNTGPNYQSPNSQAGCVKVSGMNITSYRFNNLEEVFAEYSVERLREIEKIDLKNYYIHNRDEEIIHCLLCKININQNDTFEHTVCLTHGYNKLFHNFVQKRNQRGNIDFIFLNANLIQCRYCNVVLIIEDFVQIISHVKGSIHLQRKEYCLTRFTGHHDNFTIHLQPTRTQELNQHASDQILTKNLREISLGQDNEHQVLRRPLREVKEIWHEQSCLNTISRGHNKVTTEQRAITARNPYEKIHAQIIPVNQRESSLRVSNEHQFVAWAFREEREIIREITPRKQYYRSQDYGHHMYNPPNEYYPNRHFNSHSHYNYTPVRPEIPEENNFPWVWISICGLALYWYYSKFQ